MNEEEWDKGALLARQKMPIKGLKILPHMVGITPETRKGLKWKSLKWIVQEDKEGLILKGFLRNPFKHLGRLLRSLLAPIPYNREGDLFFYGVSNEDAFKKILGDPSTLLVLGFSYCHKPFECPSGRFTEDCSHNPKNDICRQCFIGKAHQFLPPETVSLCIPTIHYIGNKIFALQKANPKKKIIFIITACEMTLTMFGDLGNMAGIRGIGIRLDGRICNTMKAFELSEKGVKPGLTVVLDKTQDKMLLLLKERSRQLQRAENGAV